MAREEETVRVGLLTLASCLTGGVLLASPASEPEPPPLEIRRTTGPIKIDGKFDEADWKNALAIPLNWEKVWGLDKDGKRQATMVKCESPVSWAKLLWDDDNLYFAFAGEDKDLIATITERDGDLWTEDAIELFVRPTLESTRYWEYEWSPANQVLDIAWGPEGDRDLARDKRWNGTGESAVLVCGAPNKNDAVDEGWQIEVRIPFSDFAAVAPRAPKAGEIWTGTVLHYSKWMKNGKKTGRLFMSNPTMDSNQIAKYIRLIFSAENSKATQAENKR